MPELSKAAGMRKTSIDCRSSPDGGAIDRLVRFRRKDGEILFMDTRIQRLESGEYMCCLEDCTIRHRLEAELLKSQRLESIGRLAGGLAHDFNNSLAIILGNLNLAQAKLMSGKALEEELDIAARACMHASGITKQMLAFSKGGDPVKALVSMEELLRESVDLKLGGSRTRVVFEIEEAVPLVEIDRGQMQQVLINLLLNADESMPDGGTLVIRLQSGKLPDEASDVAGDAAVIIEFEDEGQGIPPDAIDQVFDPYFTTKSEGTGLGLTSAYRVVQRHGGVLSLQSEHARGTTLRLHLPVAKGQKTNKPLRVQDGAMGVNMKVLIMDDNDLVRGALEAMLESLGHDVVATADGAACVEAFQEAMADDRGFDVVVLDLTVPGGQGGIWTIGELRSIDPNVCAIVASGYGSEAALAEPEEYGFKARLQKPFEIDELNRVMSGALLRSASEVG